MKILYFRIYSTKTPCTSTIPVHKFPQKLIKCKERNSSSVYQRCDFPFHPPQLPYLNQFVSMVAYLYTGTRGIQTATLIPLHPSQPPFIGSSGTSCYRQTCRVPFLVGWRFGSQPNSSSTSRIHILCDVMVAPRTLYLVPLPCSTSPPRTAVSSNQRTERVKSLRKLSRTYKLP